VQEKREMGETHKHSKSLKHLKR